MNENSKFHYFKYSTEGIEIPKRFTFPFYYEPHPLSILAAQEVQEYLIEGNEWEHNFGLESDQKGLVIGKMFGVLVVQNKHGELGYLASFSGKLADKNHHKGFVPPVFDMLTEGSFFNQGIIGLNAMNAEIEIIEDDPEIKASKELLKAKKVEYKEALEAHKAKIREGRKARKIQREASKQSNSPEEHVVLMEKMAKESLGQQTQLRILKEYWNERIKKIEADLLAKTANLRALKTKRQQTSAALQQRLFDNYQFLNAKGENKSLASIFQKIAPPAGAGECAAPKLLQYAYMVGLQPIAMAEFWWGEPPKSAVRKHGSFYPACKGKCEPILGHMLEGLAVDSNPLLENTASGRTVEIVFEDDVLAVVEKPTEFLSVPGRNVQDSVAERMKLRYPDATGPLIVHRLDMSTSGLLLIAKSLEAHKLLQKQFIKRTIKKRYVALLEGTVEGEEGTVDLPLRLDYDDRPRQMVCYDSGKAGRTHWKVLERKNGRTLIHFFPITGRTHQLRVHAAHPSGLNIPIVGDDLYGQKDKRLHLHAEYLEFEHPVTGERISFEKKVEW